MLLDKVSEAKNYFTVILFNKQLYYSLHMHFRFNVFNLNFEFLFLIVKRETRLKRSLKVNKNNNRI